MGILEIERSDGIMTIRMNRPERLNALNSELRARLAEAWTEFKESTDLEVAIYTGTGRAFCAGGDLTEMVAQGIDAAAARVPNEYETGTLGKPVIAAINGLAMGGGFKQVENADLRISVPGAIFEASEAKRQLIGGYEHGLVNGLSHAAATELAFAFRVTAQRLYELGFLNRLVEPDDLLPTARAMAEHIMSIAPAPRVNTYVMMRAMRPQPSEELRELATRLGSYGSRDDLQESRQAFTEKRAPVYSGWADPDGRKNTPTLESIRRERAGG